MVDTGFTQMSRWIFLMIGYANQIDNFQTSGESGTREALNFTEENMDKNEKWLQWAVLFFLPFWKKVIKKLLTFCYWQNCKIDFDFLTCFSCQMLWIWQWECTAHHRWDKIASDWCGFCLPLSHVLPKNGYKKLL